MNIVIVGPGALGCLLAASLSQLPEENEIRLLDHDQKRAAFLAQQGIILEKSDRRLTSKIPVTADPAGVGTPDLILLCTKAYSVSAVLKYIEPLIRPETLIIPLQNGIQHLAVFENIFPMHQWAAAVTALGATLLATGHIRHGGAGVTRLGFYPKFPNTLPENSTLNQQHKKLTRLAALFNEAGLQAEVSPAIIDHIWSKLFINVGINALTAIHNCPNGELPASPEIRETLAKAVSEAAEVAKALSINVPDDPVRLTLDVCRSTAGNISSMLQDVRNRRPTEIDAINGAIVSLAKKLGIATPTNDLLVRKIKKIENSSP